MGPLLVGLFVLLLLVEPLPVHAASTLVQQNNDGCDPCGSSTLTVSFPSPVATGNVIVVGVGGMTQGLVITAVSDSLLSPYNLAVTTSTYSGLVSVYVYDATLSTSGTDAVTVTFNYGSGYIADVYIYEISGVTTAGAVTASGSSSGNSAFVIATATLMSVPFQTGAFLLGMIEVNSNPLPVTAGQGFTLSPDSNRYSHPEYSTAGVSSPTNFPATYGGGGNGGTTHWAEVGIALNPPAPPLSTGPVGGVVEPVHKLAVFAPYLALFGVMVAVTVVMMVPWKKTQD